jgi:hypothetical protein
MFEYWLMRIPVHRRPRNLPLHRRQTTHQLRAFRRRAHRSCGSGRTVPNLDGFIGGCKTSASHPPPTFPSYCLKLSLCLVPHQDHRCLVLNMLTIIDTEEALETGIGARNPHLRDATWTLACAESDAASRGQRGGEAVEEGG